MEKKQEGGVDLNALRDQAYETALKHGWHDENFSNRHFVMLILTELAEAVEADRRGRYFRRKDFERGLALCSEMAEKEFFLAYVFVRYVKDTVEDELADAVIRLLDLAGLLNVHIDVFGENDIQDMADSRNGETFVERVYAVCCQITKYERGYLSGTMLNAMILSVFGLAKYLNINLIWHIEQKMKYNETRDRLHGKKY